MSSEVGAGVGVTVITVVASSQKFRSSGGHVTMLEGYSGFVRRDMVGILNQQCRAVSYASPGCDTPHKLTGSMGHSYIITEEDTPTRLSPFRYRLGRKYNVPHA